MDAEIRRERMKAVLATRRDEREAGPAIREIKALATGLVFDERNCQWVLHRLFVELHCPLLARALREHNGK